VAGLGWPARHRALLPRVLRPRRPRFGRSGASAWVAPRATQNRESSAGLHPRSPNPTHTQMTSARGLSPISTLESGLPVPLPRRADRRYQAMGQPAVGNLQGGPHPCAA
jgi:hypothetical protein